MFKIEHAKSGHPFAIFNGLHLHSGYNPEREAQKFVLSQLGSRVPATVLVVGPGLGYIGAELRRRGAFTVHVFLSAFTYSAAVERGDAAWHPRSDDDAMALSAAESQDAVSLRSFLRSVLNDTDTVGLEVISWSPCLEAFPAQAERALSTVADVVRESNANLTTIAAFGVRWFRNLCANFRDIGSLRTTPSTCHEVVLVAAGPSLEAAIPTLQELFHANRPELEIWAVGTALRPLIAAGVAPRMVITSDASYFALEHLNAERSSPAYCIAAPLTAARGLARRAALQVVLNQGSIIEQDLYSNCRLPSIYLPANGTVAGTALELALRVCSGRVVLVGLDLGYRDIQPHARPHSFEHYLWRQESRLQPLYSMFATRALEHSTRTSNGRRSTRQLQNYESWFRRRLSELRGRVTTLGPSAVELNVPKITPDELKTSALRATVGTTPDSVTPAPHQSNSGQNLELSDTERLEALRALFRTLELRLERITAIPNRDEFLDLLHPQRRAALQNPSSATPEDLQLLTYLNCRGVINCIQTTDTSSFQEELTKAVETVHRLLVQQKQEYLQ